MRPRPSMQKRDHERVREERYRLKQLRREENKRRKTEEKERKRLAARQRKNGEEVTDEDIAHIHLGPQQREDEQYY